MEYESNKDAIVRNSFNCKNFLCPIAVDNGINLHKRKFYARNPGEVLGNGITRDQTADQRYARR